MGVGLLAGYNTVVHSATGSNILVPYNNALLIGKAFKRVNDTLNDATGIFYQYDDYSSRSDSDSYDATLYSISGNVTSGAYSGTPVTKLTFNMPSTGSNLSGYYEIDNITPNQLYVYEIKVDITAAGVGSSTATLTLSGTQIDINSVSANPGSQTHTFTGYIVPIGGGVYHCYVDDPLVPVEVTTAAPVLRMTMACTGSSDRLGHSDIEFDSTSLKIIA